MASSESLQKTKRSLGPLSPVTHTRIWWYTFLGFAGLAFFYGTMSFEFFIGFDEKPMTLWERFLSLMTSDEFASGAGSAAYLQENHYSENLWTIGIHALAGTVMLVIGPFQFSDRFRKKWPKLHRNLGKVYVGSAIVTSVGAYIYLLNVPATEVFSGRVFTVALYGVATGTLVSAIMAYVTIRQRNVGAHRAWMMQAYLYTLGTPFLRILWISIYPFAPQMNQWDSNLVSIFGVVALLAIIPPLWLTALRLKEAEQSGRITAIQANRDTAHAPAE